jgi:hypothetical protein
VTGQTVVATANVLRSLRSPDAQAALDGVLEVEPDLVGLQEWEFYRVGQLRRSGSVAVNPLSGLRLRRRRRDARSTAGPSYVWNMAFLGGCAVGARADRYDLLWSGVRLLSRPGRADRPDRPFGLEPPRFANSAVYRDRRRDRRVALISYHLAAGVQHAGRYRDDRPRLSARHRGEIAALGRVIDRHLTAGHVVYAVGDSNFDGLRLTPLVSAWDGRDDHPGTHGSSRKIDDVHAASAATDVRLLSNASDHRAVIVTRIDD